MQASAFVGRVGGLAVALGIGAAAFAGAAPAWAGPADSTASSSSADSGAPSAPGSATAPRSRTGRASSPVAATARRVGDAPSAAASSAAVKNSAASTTSPVPRIPGPAVLGAIDAAGPAVRVTPKPPAAQAVAMSTVTSADVIESVGGGAPDLVPAPSGSSAESAPVFGVAESVPSPLLGTNPGGPVEEALSWAVAAVARQPTGKKMAAATAAASQTSSPLSNQTPTLSPQQTGQSATGVVTGSLNPVDADGDTLNFSVTSSPLRGTVVIASDGTYTYTPNASDRPTVTTDSFTVTVSDASSGFHIHGVAGLLNMLTFGLLGTSGHTSTATVNVVVAASGNSAPVATVQFGQPVASTGVVTGSVTATDADNDKLTYSGSTTTTKGTVTVNSGTGAFTYTPTATARHGAAEVGATDSVKTDAFTVTVTDGNGGSVQVPVTVPVSPQNTAPVAGTPTVGTPNSSTGVVTGSVTATDAEKDPLSYSAPTTTAKGSVSVNASTGAFTYTPKTSARGDVAGTDTFTVTVTDGYGGSTAIPVSVTVAAASTAPTTATITYVFNYTKGSTYWTPESKAAMQSAADEIASYLVVTQPVTITFDVTATNSPNSDTMASTGSDLTSSGSGFFNTVVQNKILTGVDTNGSEADGEIDVNFGIPWAYGDSVTGSQYDFKSTMMHELLHAYGFLSYTYQAGDNTDTYWTKFDSFITTSSGAKVVSPSNYRFNTAYNRNLTGGSGGLFFNGANAVSAYGGPVPLYTPKPWEAGSSVSHLDDNTFTGSDMQLMNAMADTGLGIRTISPIELGILKDIGYTVNENPAAASAMLFGFVFLRRRRNR